MNRRSFLGLSLKSAVLGIALSTNLGRAGFSVITIRKERTVLLEVFPGVQNPLPIGVNGSVMVVPTGEPVEVPYRFYEALKNAVKRTYYQPALQAMQHRDEHYYPHRVLKVYEREEQTPI